MLLTWVNQTRDTWNAHYCDGAVLIHKLRPYGTFLSFEVKKDGSVLFTSSGNIPGTMFREFNIAVREAVAHLNQPVHERDD